MTKKWSLGAKIFAGVVGGSLALGATWLFLGDEVGSYAIVKLIKAEGVTIQRPGDPTPTDPSLTKDAGLAAMVANFGQQNVDVWTKAGISFWASPATAAKVVAAAAGMPHKIKYNASNAESVRKAMVSQ
jgi:hypothetical protein